MSDIFDVNGKVVMITHVGQWDTLATVIDQVVDTTAASSYTIGACISVDGGIRP